MDYHIAEWCCQPPFLFIPFYLIIYILDPLSPPRELIQLVGFPGLTTRSILVYSLLCTLCSLHSPLCVVLVICHYVILPQLLAAENDACLLSHSFGGLGIQVQLSWGLYFVRFVRLQPRSKVLTGEESTSRFTYIAVDRIQLLKGRWSESCSPVLVRCWQHRSLSPRQLPASSEPMRERERWLWVEKSQPFEI